MQGGREGGNTDVGLEVALVSHFDDMDWLECGGKE